MVPADKEAIIRQVFDCARSLGYGTVIDEDHPVTYFRMIDMESFEEERCSLVSYEAVIEYAALKGGYFTLWSYSDGESENSTLENNLHFNIDLQKKHISFNVWYHLHSDNEIVPDLIKLFHLLCQTLQPLYGYTFDEDQIMRLNHWGYIKDMANWYNEFYASYDNGLPTILFWMSYFDNYYWQKLDEERLEDLEYTKTEDEAGVYIQLSDIPLDYKLAVLIEDGTYQLWDDSDWPPRRIVDIQIKAG